MSTGSARQTALKAPTALSGECLLLLTKQHLKPGLLSIQPSSKVLTSKNGTMKTVGHRLRGQPVDPVSCFLRAARLRDRLDKLNPFPRPRGFVVKARTWEEYEAWRARQSNPRLW